MLKLIVPSRGWEIAFLSGLVAMVLGGSFLTLLSYGILHLYRPDFLNFFVDQRVEILISRFVGIALIVGPLCILPYVVRMTWSKQSIKYGTGRHVKNRAEEIWTSLELLRSQSAGVLTPEQLKLIVQAENACFQLVVSVGTVLSSDGSESGSPEFTEQTKKQLR